MGKIMKGNLPNGMLSLVHEVCCGSYVTSGYSGLYKAGGFHFNFTFNTDITYVVVSHDVLASYIKFMVCTTEPKHKVEEELVSNLDSIKSKMVSMGKIIRSLDVHGFMKREDYEEYVNIGASIGNVVCTYEENEERDVS